jgi:biotin transport system substrate-specific component
VEDEGMKPSTLVSFVMSCAFSALIAVGAFIALPIGPVPIVLANFFAILAGLVLGPVWGGLSVLLYIGLGTLGLPVFAGGAGGLARLLGPTGGFLAGYLLGAIAAGCLSLGHKGKLWRFLLASAIGFFIIYLAGLPWLHFAIHSKSLAKTLMVGCVPFLPGDAVKLILAALVGQRVRAWLDARFTR